MTLPEQIKQIREGLNLSQRELAKKMEVPQSTVVRIESGEMNISQATIQKFCDATNTFILFVSKDKNIQEETNLQIENQKLKNKLVDILKIITNL